MAVADQTFELSTTAFAEASSCLKRYYYHQVEGLVPKPGQVKKPLRLGIWIHACLEAHAKDRDWRVALDRLVEQAQQLGVAEEDIGEIARQTVEIMLGYFTYWADQPGEAWQPVAVEEPIYYDVPGVVRLRATVDLIARYKGGLWLIENKSTQQIPDANWRAVDPQTALQYVVCEATGKYQLDGILFNYLLTSKASVPRVKNDGRFYANTALTTTRSYWQAAEEVRARWKPGEDYQDADAYLEAMAARYIADGKFYQRYAVYRPKDMILETIGDVASWVQILKRSFERNHWPRSQHIIVCSRFCPYGPLCMTEYVNGRVSEATREELYQLDDGRREGRLDWGDEG